MAKEKSLTRLHQLKAKEVSLVPQGANGRKFMIFKNVEGKGMSKTHEELHKLISKTDPSILKAVEEALAAHVGKAEGEEGQPAGMDEQAQTAVKAVVRILSPFKDRIPPALMHAVLDQVGFAVEEAGEDEGEEAHDPEGYADEALESEEAEGEGLEKTEHLGSDESGVDKNKIDDEEADEENEESHGSQSGAMGAGEGGMVGKAFMALPAHLNGKVSKEHLIEAHGMASKAMAEHLAKSVDDNASVGPGQLDKAMDYAHNCMKSHLEKLGYKMYPDAEMQLKSKDGEPVDNKGEKVAKSNTAIRTDGAEKARQERELIFKQNKELVQKNVELEKSVSDLRKEIAEGKMELREKEIVAKAATFTHLGLPKEDIVAQLKDADKAGKEAFERICKSFETLNKQGKESKIFLEIGSNLPESGNGGDIEAKIQAAANAYVAKSGEKLTEAQAYTRFMETSEGQKMYADYKSNRKGGI